MVTATQAAVAGNAELQLSSGRSELVDGNQSVTSRSLTRAENRPARRCRSLRRCPTLRKSPTNPVAASSSSSNASTWADRTHALAAVRILASSCSDAWRTAWRTRSTVRTTRCFTECRTPRPSRFVDNTQKTPTDASGDSASCASHPAETPIGPVRARTVAALPLWTLTPFHTRRGPSLFDLGLYNYDGYVYICFYCFLPITDLLR